MPNPSGVPPQPDEGEKDYQGLLPESRRSHPLPGALRATSDARQTSGSLVAAIQKPTSIVIAGLGGQGVLRAASIVAKAAFLAGYDVKTSEVHGMSQRGGSVYSDVRFGERVDSPMVPAGEADYFVALSADQVEPHRWLLGERSVVITPADIEMPALENRRSLNVALLGALSLHLPIDECFFAEAIRGSFSPDTCGPNLNAFALGRRARVSSAHKGASHG